jgi:hypothetical protein
MNHARPGQVGARVRVVEAGPAMLDTARHRFKADIGLVEAIGTGTLLASWIIYT